MALKTQLTKEQELDIVEKYKSKRFTSHQLAKLFKKDKTNILNILRFYNVSVGHHKFTNEEEEYIITKYTKDKISCNKIASLFKSSKRRIAEILRKNNIEIHQNKFTRNQELEIINKSKEENMTLRRLGRLYFTDKHVISRILQKHNIKLAPFKRSRKYIINKNYFETINSEGKSYFLGLLYADSYIENSKKIIGISLQEGDEEILNKFREELETNAPLYFSKTKRENSKNSYIFRIGELKMYKDLEKLGMFPRKSLKINFPNSDQVPENLLRHFIRGYFCGNGCIGIYHKHNNQNCTIIVYSSVQFCQSLREVVHKTLGLNSSVRFRESKIPGLKMGIWYICGKKVFKFLDWIYEGSNFHIQRKYDKYITEKAILEEKERAKLPKTPILV